MTSIARGLSHDGIACPSAYDRQRNPHRNTEVWESSAILLNPRYTGHQVWNKQRTDEVLIDVEDIALGHEGAVALSVRRARRIAWLPLVRWIERVRRRRR